MYKIAHLFGECHSILPGNSACQSEVLRKTTMDSSIAALVTIPRQLEDPLEHLPFSTIVDYPKGSIIYSAAQFSTTLFLVMDGKVKVSRVNEGGRQFVIDIYHPDEFFGESAFLNMPYHLD